jgi:UPF0042 nucleotide-binding protein
MSTIALTSFSFKRGIPEGADMVFDVRFLKNPYYEPTLTDLTGLDTAAGAYIETDPQFAPFFEYLQALIGTMLPRYLKDVKPDFSVAIGCTGGRHRSVYVVQKLTGILRAQGYTVTATHRELSHVG